MDNVEYSLDVELRDDFAIRILNGFLAGNCGNGTTPDQLAAEAYDFADAVLRVRNKDKKCRG